MMGRNFHQRDTTVKLDEYISDLNLEIAQDGFSCQPMHKDGFAYMWAGAKATYGVRRGKVCFEVKIVENMPVSTSEFTDAHIVRVGWSTDAATLQLGEDKNSFGYGGTAKKSEGRKFCDYGRRFDTGDVVGCYLSIGGGWVDISYCVNGYHCGTAYKVRWDTDEALFPHVLTKNCRIEVNFGQAHNPYFSLQPGYKFIGNLPVDQRVTAVAGPSAKEECEVIMMVGLPGVGKTTWAMNYAKLHPNKKYNILGTDAIIDKMRVQGLPRKDNFGGRWDVLIKQASECFNIMLRKASNCKRNLILDQTNVYASARKRKVRQYKDAGYTVNAMVLVPTDDDMISRSTQRTIKEGKEVPEAAVYDMKANFSLPHEDEKLFSSITFLELQQKDAENLVVQYNIDASLKGYKSKKQSGQGPNENQKEISEKRQTGGTVTNKIPSHERKELTSIKESNRGRPGGDDDRTSRAHGELRRDGYRSRDESYEPEKRRKFDDNHSRDDGRRSHYTSRDDRSRNTSKSSGPRADYPERRDKAMGDNSYPRYGSPRRSERADRDENRRQGSRDRRPSYDDSYRDNRARPQDKDRYENDRRSRRAGYSDQDKGNPDSTSVRKDEFGHSEYQRGDRSNNRNNRRFGDLDDPPIEHQRQSLSHAPENMQNEPRYQDDMRNSSFYHQGRGMEVQQQRMPFGMQLEAPHGNDFFAAPNVEGSRTFSSANQSIDAPVGLSRRNQVQGQAELMEQPYSSHQSLNPINQPGSLNASGHQGMAMENQNRWNHDRSSGYNQGWDDSNPSAHSEYRENFHPDIGSNEPPCESRFQHPGNRRNERDQDDFHRQAPMLGHEQKYSDDNMWERGPGNMHGVNSHQQSQEHSASFTFQDVKPDPHRNLQPRHEPFPQESPNQDRSYYEALTPKLSDVDFESLKATLANVRQAHQTIGPLHTSTANLPSQPDPRTSQAKGNTEDFVRRNIQPVSAFDASPHKRQVEKQPSAYSAHRGNIQSYQDFPPKQSYRDEPERIRSHEGQISQDHGSEKQRRSPTHYKEDRRRDEDRGNKHSRRSRSPGRRSQRDRSPHRDSRSLSGGSRRLKESSYHEEDESKVAKEVRKRSPPHRKTLLKTPKHVGEHEHDVSWTARKPYGRDGPPSNEVLRNNQAVAEYPDDSEPFRQGANWNQKEAVERLMDDDFGPSPHHTKVRNRAPETQMRGLLGSHPADMARHVRPNKFQETITPANKFREENFPRGLRPHRPPLLETPDMTADHLQMGSEYPRSPHFRPFRPRGSTPRLRPGAMRPARHQNSDPEVSMGQRPPGAIMGPFNPHMRGVRPSGFRGPRVRPHTQGEGHRGPRPWDGHKQMRPRGVRPFIRR